MQIFFPFEHSLRAGYTLWATQISPQEDDILRILGLSKTQTTMNRNACYNRRCLGVETLQEQGSVGKYSGRIRYLSHLWYKKELYGRFQQNSLRLNHDHKNEKKKTEKVTKNRLQCLLSLVKIHAKNTSFYSAQAEYRSSIESHFNWTTFQQRYVPDDL